MEAAVKAWCEEAHRFHRDLRVMSFVVFACFILMCMSEKHDVPRIPGMLRG